MHGETVKNMREKFMSDVFDDDDDDDDGGGDGGGGGGDGCGSNSVSTRGHQHYKEIAS